MYQRKLRENDFRIMSNALLLDEKAMGFFRAYGISPETLKIMMIGLDDEGYIRCPIFNSRNKIVGDVQIKDYMIDGGTYVYSAYGFLGNPASKGATIVIGKSLIDVLLLWQMGVDNPVMVVSRENPVYLDTYKDVTFVDQNDDLADLLYCSLYTYAIPDLPLYAAMHKELPKRIAMENREKRIDILKNVMYIEGKTFIYTNRKGNVLDEDNNYYRTFKNIDFSRTFKYNDQKYVFAGNTIKVPNNYKIEKAEDPKVIYEDLFKIIYTRLPFISEDQARVISLFIIYFYTISYKMTHVSMLHIITPSEIQLGEIYNVLKYIIPSFGKDSISIQRREKDKWLFFDYPKIILDGCLHEYNSDIGPKILITDSSYLNRESKIRRAYNTEIVRMRARLLNLLFEYKVPPIDELENMNVYLYFMVFHQVGEIVGLDMQERKRLFNTVCMSAQRLFKDLDMKYYIKKHSTILDQDLEFFAGPSLEKECKK